MDKTELVPIPIEYVRAGERLMAKKLREQVRNIDDAYLSLEITPEQAAYIDAQPKPPRREYKRARQR